MITEQNSAGCSPAVNPPRAPRKPRDVGLALWYLLHKVRVDSELTEAVIEGVRQKCRMSSERLAELRAGPFQHLWHRMVEKRARRLAHFRAHGSIQPGWTPPAPGEQDRSAQVAALRHYRTVIAPQRARKRNRLAGKDHAFTEWLTQKLYRSRKIHSPQKRIRVLNALHARLTERLFADELSADEARLFAEMKKPDQGRQRNRLGPGSGGPKRPPNIASAFPGCHGPPRCIGGQSPPEVR